MSELTIAELELIKSSLAYTKKNISDSPDQSYQFKREQLERIDKVVEKVSAIIKNKKENFLA